MFTRISENGGILYLHIGAAGLKTTKAFTHGRAIFDPRSRTVQFARMNPVPIPNFLKHVWVGATLSFRLVGLENKLQPQRRELVVHEGADGILFAPGAGKSPRRRTTITGCAHRTYKFRAFFSHPGFSSDAAVLEPQLPVWMKQSFERQREFWNRLVYLCNEARHACTAIDSGAVSGFVEASVRPALYAFNVSHERPTDKVSLPVALSEVQPSVFALRRFAVHLRHLEKVGRPTPAGLADAIFAFSEDMAVDFTPIRDFQRNLTAIFARERLLPDCSMASFRSPDGVTISKPVYRTLDDPNEIVARRADRELRNWEWRPVATAFRSALQRRFTVGASFYEGWPRYKIPEPIHGSMHFYLNGDRGDPGRLMQKGIRGLRVDAAVDPSSTGHAALAPGSRKSRRKLCRAEISFHDTLSDEQWSFSFVVLLHRELPAESQIKQWRLVSNDEGLWLCFVIETCLAMPKPQGSLAAIHIGWTTNDNDVTVASIYSPGHPHGEFQQVLVNTVLSPEPSQKRTSFRINMGPSRWGRRSPYWVHSQTGRAVTAMSPGAIQVTDTWDGIERLSRWRDLQLWDFRQKIKSRIDPTLHWVNRADVEALIQFVEERCEEQLIVEARKLKESQVRINLLLTTIFRRITRRLEDGYFTLAHKICRFLMVTSTKRIAIQNAILAQLAKAATPSNSESHALKNARFYRHRLAPGKLLLAIELVAAKYGMSIVRVENPYLTRKHRGEGGGCGYINAKTADRIVRCVGCGEEYEQEQNALKNMVAAAAVAVRDLNRAELEQI